MKKFLNLALALALALTLTLTGCGAKEVRLEDVKSVTLTVGGPDQAEYTIVTFGKPDNIKKLFDVEDELKKYNSANDVETWKLDIKIEYHLQDGNTIEHFYKGIRPADDYLEEIYNTLEYKEQTIPLFKLDKGEIKKIRFYSNQNKYSFETDDLKLIEITYNNILKHFRETNYYGEEDGYSIADVEFLNSQEEVIARGTILREEKQWKKYFQSYEQLKKLRYWAKDIQEIVLEKGKRIVRVTDPLVIERILESYKGCHTYYSVVSVEVIPKNSSGRHLYGSYEKNKVPDFVENLF